MHERRLLTVLTAAALTACGSADVSSGAEAISAARSHDVVVMTRNLYVGADLFEPFAVDPELALSTAAKVFNDILASDVPGRMAAIADEIAGARPDLVGLQEAYQFIVTPLGMPEVILLDLDFLALLDGALAANPALSYRRVAEEAHTVITVPFPPSVEVPFATEITLIDRDAIIADLDVDVLTSTGGDFAAEFVTSLVGIDVHLKRGWVEVTAERHDDVFRFVNTHLEVKEFGPLQSLQALELVALLGTTSPLVLVGDMNSDPGDPPNPLPPASTIPTPYTILTAAVEDAWRSASQEGAYTCCFDADITPPSRPLFERVDLILLRGADTTRALHRTGVAPVAALGPRYASDHAGVVGTLRFESAALAAH